MANFSYVNPKARKGLPSAISGRGLFAIKEIKKGELVALKGGEIISWQTFKSDYEHIIGELYLQIDDDFVIASTTPREVEEGAIFLNHSCSPNVGMRGEISFVAMRDIYIGEELAIDYAMIENKDYEMPCKCGAQNCRKIITGMDWKDKLLQNKYGNYFSPFILAKIKK